MGLYSGLPMVNEMQTRTRYTAVQWLVSHVRAGLTSVKTWGNELPYKDYFMTKWMSVKKLNK